jgi:cobalt/nickel transport system permease protein
LDARPKLVLALATIAALAATPPGAWPVFAFIGVLVAAAVVAARAPVLPLLRGVLVALPFMLVALPSLFTRPGTALFELHIWHWTFTGTNEGLDFFLSVVVKALLSVTAAGLLAITTPFHEMATAMRYLRMPGLLVAIIASTYRYLFVLADEAGRLARARSARSVQSTRRHGGTLLWRARVLGGMIGSLFLRTYERSERIYWAMASRGYDGELRSLPQPRPSPVAWTLTFAVLALLLGVEIAARVVWR